MQLFIASSSLLLSRELHLHFLAFSKLHSFALTTTSRLTSSKLLCFNWRTTKHSRACVLCRLLRSFTWLSKRATIACRIVLHLLHLLIHTCIFVSLEISTRHADLWIIHCPSTHSFLSKFFLDAFCLLFSLGFSDFLLTLKDSFVSWVHLKISL